MRSFSFKVKTSDLRAALRDGASVGLPLLAIYASGQIHFAVYAAFGAPTSLYGHSETVQRRVETQVVVGVALVATLALAAISSAAQGPERLRVWRSFSWPAATGLPFSSSRHWQSA
jgi:hypothetical protein